MHTIPEAFYYATTVGLWPTITWKAKTTKKLYDLYTLFNILMMGTLFITQFIGILCLTDNMYELVDSLHLFLSVSNGCIKSANILLRRENFIKLANMLLEDRCLPKNSKEKEIRQNFDWQSRILTISMCILGEVTAFTYAMKPLFYIQEKYTLSARAWLPYDINSSLTFWPTFVQQSFAAHLIAAWNVSNDVIAIGFMLQICSQLQLISYRLETLPKIMQISNWQNDKVALQYEQSVIKQCVLHHLYVMKIIKNFELTFAPIILSQYCLSGFTICMTMYEVVINKQDTSSLIIVVIYLISMTIELGIYCWYGNEVTLKGLQINDSICQGDWFLLHPRTIKCLKIMMIRISSPIFVTCGPLIHLSNASYKSILKVSYSVYNVLQRMY